VMRGRVPCKFECLSDVLASFFNKSLKEQRPKKFDLCQKGTETNSFGINMAL
jgi:hypothetical protein